MFRRLGHLFEFLFRRRRLEDNLDEELRSSVELVADRYTAQGMPAEEAWRAARLEFEGLEQVKENVRDGLAGSALQTFLDDVRHAWRGLGRRPSFLVIPVITLALGIGVNAAVFSVFHAVLMRPLPYDHPEQLALIWGSFRTAGTARAPVSGPILGEIEHRNRSMSGVAGIWTITRTFTGSDPEQVKSARVTPNFFDVLGIRAAYGHTFTKDENGTPAIMLANGFFRRRFAADKSLIGKSVPLEGEAATVVGVLPAGFELHFAPDANVPADVQSFDTFGYDIYKAGRKQYYIRVVGRLKPGVPMAEAQRDLDRVAAEIRGAYAEYAAIDLQFHLAGMQADAVRDVQPALVALFAGAAFVLLICCVNVTSLLMARASDRRKEMALRLAMGASRSRILRQLFAEGSVLCFLGGVAGIAVGWAGLHGLLAIRPERLAHIGDTGLSWPVLGFAATCSLAAAMFFGFAPAIESFRMDIIATLRAGRGWLGRLQRRAGGTLVAGEIALAFVLVTGATLAARTLSKIEQVRPGFEPRQLLVFQIAGGMPRRGVAEWEAQLAALPGVERVGATSHLPLDTDIPNWYAPYRPEGVTEQTSALVADHRCVTPGYLAAMGARLIEGRYFDQQDRDGGQQVVIVDELLARSTWPGQSALGKKIAASHVTNNGFQDLSSVVVGVVEHMHNHSLTREVRGEIYIPFEQSPRSPLTFVLRTRVPPLSLAPAIRGMLRERSKNAAMAKVRPMTAYVEREIAPVSFTAVLAAVFGGLALLLAATGVYGVLDYQVSRRRPEMGIRMAVGARARDVLRLVLGEGLELAAAGVLLGAVASLAATRWLGALIYGVSPRDAVSYGAALLLLPAAALLGCWRPARRAAASSPAESIREE